MAVLSIDTQRIAGAGDAVTLKDALIGQGAALTVAAGQFRDAESALAQAVPAVAG
jgi:hypothetical protein